MAEIYYNGTIVTMRTEGETIPAVAVENEIIADVGEEKELRRKYPYAEPFDLNGEAMFPAFIDAHSHFTGVANSLLQVNLSDCLSFSDIKEKIQKARCDGVITEGWMIANSYDHTSLEEKTHPNIDFLDSICPDMPLVIQHASGHTGLFNSKALELLGVTENTVPPSGGKICKTDGRLNGYMEENAFVEYLKKVPMPKPEALMRAYRKAQNIYASFGVTSIQEGMMTDELIPLYKKLTEENRLFLDVTGYAGVQSFDKYLKNFENSLGKFHDNFRLGGYKIFLDGSPQAKTAWMRKPYEGSVDYYGYPTMSDEQVMSAVEKAFQTGFQILAHCNGDRAADQFIDCIAACQKKGMNVEIIRPVMVHAQFLPTDRMGKVKQLGIIPSFFSAHAYYWGDVHLQNLGEERAKNLSPAHTAELCGVPFTIHRDSPVLDENVLDSIHIAVNRETKSGTVLGESERISVYQALKAHTVNAAYQYFDEKVRGTLETGKKADFVILSENPLTVDKKEINKIKVRYTVKNGNIVYSQNLN